MGAPRGTYTNFGHHLFRVGQWVTGFTVALLCFLDVTQAASNSGITYHGRILKPDGTPLVGTSVQFKLQIRSPGNESCLLYEESQNINMANSAGVFSISLNDGTGIRTDSSGYTFDSIFANRSAYTFTTGNCATGTTYTPNSGDGRAFVVSFKDEDMQSFEQLATQPVNFAPTAIQAKYVGGFGPANLLRFDDTAAASNSNVLNIGQLTNLLALINGTSTQYVNSTANGAVMPVVAAAPATPAAGAVWFNSTTGALQYYNGTSTQSLGTSSASGTVTSITAGSGLTGGTITTTGTIALGNLGTAGTYLKVVTDATGRVASGSTSLAETDLPNIVTAGKVSGSAITSGTIGGTTAINTSGAITTSGTVTAGALTSTSESAHSLSLFNTGNTFAITLSVPSSLAANYNFVLPLTVGASGNVLTTDGAGNLSWAASSANLSSGQSGILPIANGGTGTATGSITGSGALTFAAGGTNQSVALTPTGSGSVLLGSTVGIGTTSPTAQLEVDTQNAAVPAAIFKAAASQSTNIIEVHNSANAIISGVTPSGRFASLSGSAAAPGLTFMADSTSGLFSPNTNLLGFSTGGVERARIDSLGNLGIGTTLPAVSLDLSSKTDAVALPKGATEPATPAAGWIRYNTASNTVEYYNSASWVSMATSSGAQSFTSDITMSGAGTGLAVTNAATVGTTLAVTGLTTLTGGFTSAGTAAVTNSTASTSTTTGAETVAGGLGVAGTVNANILAAASGALATPSHTFISDLNSGMWSPATGALAFSTNSTEKLRILSNGNVGMGTTLPVSNLQVSGSPAASANYGLISLGANLFDGSTTGHFVGNSNGTLLAADVASSYSGDLANFQIGGSRRFSIDSSGNALASQGLILSNGTSNQGAIYNQYGHGRFFVADNNGTWQISLGPYNSSMPNYMALGTGLYLGGTGTAKSTLDINGSLAIGSAYAGNSAAPTNGLLVAGNVGIGTAAPLGALDVIGTIKAGLVGPTSPTTLNAAAATTDTTLTVASTTGYPSSGLLYITNSSLSEAVSYTGTTATTFTGVTRGLYGTSALAWSTGVSTDLIVNVIAGASNTVAPRVMVTQTKGIGYGETPSGWVTSSGVQYAGTLYSSNGLVVSNANQGMAFGTSSAYIHGYGASSTADSIAVFTNSTQQMTVNGSGNVGIGTTSPSVSLDLGSRTDALRLPNGTTAQEPATPLAGMLRFNSTTSGVEFYSGTAWTTLSSATTSSFTGVTSISDSTGNITLAPQTSTGAVIVNSGAAATSSSTGAVQVTGGEGVSGAIYAGTTINAGTTVTAATSMIAPQIYGSTTASGNILIDGTSNTTKGNVLLATAGGDVGVGTASPAYVLDVYNNVNADATTSSALNVVNQVGNNKHFTTIDGASITLNNQQSNNATSVNGVIVQLNNASVGTTANGGSFTVTNSVNYPSTTNAVYGSVINTTNNGTNALIGGNFNVSQTTNSATVSSMTGVQSTTTNSSNSTITADYGVNATVANSGTTTAAYGLYSTISNSGTIANAYGLYLGPVAGTTKYGLYENSGGLNYMAGNLGIGTASPSTALDVAGTSSGASLNLAYLENKGTGNGTSANLAFGIGGTVYGAIRSRYTSGGYLDFMSTGSTPQLTIDPSGRLGVGTTSPAVSLDLSAKSDAIALPQGTTEPASPAAGWIRYNTTSNTVEYYNASAWVSLASGGGSSFSSDVTMSGSGTGLAVTNNETVGGTMTVTGNTVLSGTLSVEGGTASGTRAIALGASAVASGPDSFAVNGGTAYAQLSFASGYNTHANGVQSFVSGENSTASASDAIAMGNSNTASGQYSAAFGLHTTAPAYGELVLGLYNATTGSESGTSSVSTDPVFMIGNGSSGGTSTAFTVLKNGNVGIGTMAPAAPLQIVATNTGTSGTIAQSMINATENPSAATSANYSGQSINLGLSGGNNYTGTVYGSYIAAISNSPATTSNMYGSYALAQQGYNSGTTNNLVAHYADANNGGTGGNATGTYNYVRNTGTSTVTATGTTNWVEATTGAVTNVYGSQTQIKNSGAGTMANAYGNFIASPLNTNGGAITNFYGLYIQTPTAAGTNYAIYSQGGNNYFGGSVGIGTTSPGAKLQVSGGNIQIDNNTGLTSAAGATIATGSGGGTWAIQPANGNAYDILHINNYQGTTIFDILPSGSVGIGTTSPQANLDITGYTRTATSNATTVGTQGAYTMWNISGGQGETDFVNQRGVGGGGFYFYNATNAGVIGTSIATINSSGTFTTSDRRLKTDLTLIESPLEKVLSLDGYNYHWKDKERGTNRQIGLIAQEVQKVFPEAVNEDPKSTYLAVGYDHLVAPVISALKEFYKKWHDDSQALHQQLNVQNSEINKLKLENTQIKSENAQIKTENAAIKARLDRIEKALEQQH